MESTGISGVGPNTAIGGEWERLAIDDIIVCASWRELLIKATARRPVVARLPDYIEGNLGPVYRQPEDVRALGSVEDGGRANCTY